MTKKFWESYINFFEPEELTDDENVFLRLNFLLKIKIGVISFLIIAIFSVVTFKVVTNAIHQNHVRSSLNAKKEALNAKRKDNYKKKHFENVKNDVEATLTKTEEDHMRYAGNIDDSKKPELKAHIDDDIKSLKAEIKPLDNMTQDDDVNGLKTRINNELYLLNSN